MPLQTGKSQSAFEHNLKAELAAGKPKDQALAIAYAQKRRADESCADGIGKALELLKSTIEPSPIDKALSIARQIAGECGARADADKWITVHPHSGTGTPALIGEDGTVKGGMGGKFTGQNIKDAHGTKKFTSGETNAETEARKKKEEKPSEPAKQEGEKVESTSEPEQKTEKPAQEAPKFKQARHISEGIPQGQSKVVDRKYGDSPDMSIVWENENSYGIPDPNYMGTGYYAQHRWAKGENVSKSKYIFLPKSQVTIEGEGANRKIAAISDWLAKEKGLPTETIRKQEDEADKIESELQQSANDRYNRLIQHAKANGITSARVGMRTSTILDKLKEAGIDPPKEYQQGGREEMAAASQETKYRDIPGRGKGVVLNVPFSDKDEAKAHGARWSPDIKKWYFPEGAEFPEGLKKWRHDSASRADSESEYSDEEVAQMDRESRITGTVSPLNKIISI